jgi:hypothetical protein
VPSSLFAPNLLESTYQNLQNQQANNNSNPST